MGGSSVSILEQVIEIQEQTLAEDHPHQLASQQATAVAYRANRRVKEAVSLLGQVVRILEPPAHSHSLLPTTIIDVLTRPSR